VEILFDRGRCYYSDSCVRLVGVTAFSERPVGRCALCNKLLYIPRAHRAPVWTIPPALIQMHPVQWGSWSLWSRYLCTPCAKRVAWLQLCWLLAQPDTYRQMLKIWQQYPLRQAYTHWLALITKHGLPTRCRRI